MLRLSGLPIGLISPRSRLGTVVVGPVADVFRGRVVIVNQGDALIAYLDTGAAPGTITLENTFVAGESRR